MLSVCPPFYTTWWQASLYRAHLRELLPLQQRKQAPETYSNPEQETWKLAFILPNKTPLQTITAASWQCRHTEKSEWGAWNTQQVPWQRTGLYSLPLTLSGKCVETSHSFIFLEMRNKQTVKKTQTQTFADCAVMGPDTFIRQENNFCSKNTWFASHPHNNPCTWSKPASKSHSSCAEFSILSHLSRTAIPWCPGLQTAWISTLLRLLRLLALKLIWSELLLEMNFFGKVKCQPFLVPTSAQISGGIIVSQCQCKKLITLIRLPAVTFEGLSQWENPGTLPSCSRGPCPRCILILIAGQKPPPGSHTSTNQVWNPRQCPHTLLELGDQGTRLNPAHSQFY